MVGGTLGLSVTPPELFTLAAHWLALWLGLYLLARRPRARATVLAAAAFIALSSYFLSSAYLLAPEPVPGADFWGIWVGNWMPFAPALLFHAFICLTGTRLPRQRTLLAVAYLAAAAVSVAGWSDTMLYQYVPPQPGATTDVNGTLSTGPLYPLQAAQVLVTLGLALLVLVRTSRGELPLAPSTRRWLNAMIAGTVLTLLGALVMFLSVLLGGSLQQESYLDLALVVGGVLLAVSFARYPGLLEGQLLRTDLKSSLLAVAMLMAAFTVLVIAAGASFRVLAGLGWLIVAGFVFRDELQALADRVFFGAGSRAERSDLRTAANYAGSGERLDVEALSPGQSAGLVGYLSAVDRASLAAARLEDVDPRLLLLSRYEFSAVREALGLAADWSPESGVDDHAVRTHVAEVLEPRERQALGLKYLGYADKEMARLMGVKPNVPRSYLSAGKRKLNIAAGAPTMLFAHFAGLVEADALPLLAVRGDKAAHRGDADLPVGASAGAGEYA